jgi:protein-tyrosine phosphatase
VIDLHCHILPGLDDGALDLDDSVAMAREAEQDGIAVVCATPHIRADHSVRIDELAARVACVQQALADRGTDVRIAPGGELAETEADRLSDAQLRLVTLGGEGGWVLLEPAPGPLGDRLHAVVERLERRGVGSIIAHPERHAGVDFEQQLGSLAEAGCLIQWTAEFVAAASPGDLVLRLAAEGLLHLLGSDAHSSHRGRPMRLSTGFARLAGVCAPARVAWMVDEAPRAILRGECVTLPR